MNARRPEIEDAIALHEALVEAYRRAGPAAEGLYLLDREVNRILREDFGYDELVTLGTTDRAGHVTVAAHDNPDLQRATELHEEHHRATREAMAARCGGVDTPEYQAWLYDARAQAEDEIAAYGVALAYLAGCLEEEP